MNFEDIAYDLFEKNNLAKDLNNDKGHGVINRRVKVNDGPFKNKKIDLYVTDGTGHKIRDAITGTYYPHTVGSKQENLYFKVALSTGEIKTKIGSNTLFYLSPEQYERHLYTNLNENIKNSWYKRVHSLNNLYNSSAKA